MNEDIEKLLWILFLLILTILLLEVSVYFIVVVIPYCLYMGAYFRGKNWILDWEEVSVIKGKKVK
jgi:hypothetical protein